MKNIVIDDERTFLLENSTHLRTSKDGLAELAKLFCDYQFRYGENVILWLDHDLGHNDDVRIVIDFLALVLMQEMILYIHIHSQNPVSETLVPVLQKAGYKCQKSQLPPMLVPKEG